MKGARQTKSLQLVLFLLHGGRIVKTTANPLEFWVNRSILTSPALSTDMFWRDIPCFPCVQSFSVELNARGCSSSFVIIKLGEKLSLHSGLAEAFNMKRVIKTTNDKRLKTVGQGCKFNMGLLHLSCFEAQFLFLI